jgi:hypothetical protein
MMRPRITGQQGNQLKDYFEYAWQTKQHVPNTLTG